MTSKTDVVESVEAVESDEFVSLYKACKRLVEENVLARVNRFIDELLRNELAYEEEWYQDLLTQEEEAEVDVYKEWSQEEGEGEEDEDEEEADDGAGVERGLREPFEFYMVSTWFAEELRKQGALLTFEFDMPVWGRETTGQLIWNDKIIERIALSHKRRYGKESRYWAKEWECI